MYKLKGKWYSQEEFIEHKGPEREIVMVIKTGYTEY